MRAHTKTNLACSTNSAILCLLKLLLFSFLPNVAFLFNEGSVEEPARTFWHPHDGQTTKSVPRI